MVTWDDGDSSLSFVDNMLDWFYSSPTETENSPKPVPEKENSHKTTPPPPATAAHSPDEPRVPTPAARKHMAEHPPPPGFVPPPADFHQVPLDYSSFSPYVHHVFNPFFPDGFVASHVRLGYDFGPDWMSVPTGHFVVIYQKDPLTLCAQDGAGRILFSLLIPRPLAIDPRNGGLTVRRSAVTVPEGNWRVGLEHDPHFPVLYKVVS